MPNSSNNMSGRCPKPSCEVAHLYNVYYNVCTTTKLHLEIKKIKF